MLNSLRMYLALGFHTGSRENGHQTANSNKVIDIISILSLTSHGRP